MFFIQPPYFVFSQPSSSSRLWCWPHTEIPQKDSIKNTAGHSIDLQKLQAPQFIGSLKGSATLWYCQHHRSLNQIKHFFSESLIRFLLVSMIKFPGLHYSSFFSVCQISQDRRVPEYRNSETPAPQNQFATVITNLGSSAHRNLCTHIGVLPTLPIPAEPVML